MGSNADGSETSKAADMSKSPTARFTTRISVLSPDGSCTVTSSGSREPAANFTVIDFTALAIAGSFGTRVYESPEVPETPKPFREYLLRKSRL